MQGENLKQNGAKMQLVRLDDDTRIRVFNQQKDTLIKVEQLRQQAGCYLPQAVETLKQFDEFGIKIGNLALEHTRGHFPADVIKLTAEFDMEQSPYEDFRMLFTTFLVCQKANRMVELEGAMASVLFSSPEDDKETRLVYDLLNGEEEPVARAAKLVAAGFLQVFPGYSLMSETEDSEERKYDIQSITFTFVRNVSATGPFTQRRM